MIRDLVEISVNMVRHEKAKLVQKRARQFAEERILDILLPVPQTVKKSESVTDEVTIVQGSTREKMRDLLYAGKFDDRIIELEIFRQQMPFIEIFSQAGIGDFSGVLEDAFGKNLPKKKKMRKMPVKEARKYIQNEEADKLVDMDEVINEARQRTENSGIVFIDEIDKITGGTATHGPDVSREGVQRDLLPIVEGSNVMTKHGMIKTNYILFIAAGAFHSRKPSDLIPEMQGRFPIRVELSALTTEDFQRILVEPENSLIKQYSLLLATEGINLEFTDSAIKKIALIASEVNTSTENIGARRLHTVMTKILEELLFKAPNISEKQIKITDEYVDVKLKDIVSDVDMSRYIL